MDDNYAQLMPPEETRDLKPKLPGEHTKKNWNDAKKWWSDFSNFTRSVWQNPYETDVSWHKLNAERLKRGRGGRKPNWLQLSKLSPELRNLYDKIR